MTFETQDDVDQAEEYARGVCKMFVDCFTMALGAPDLDYTVALTPRNKFSGPGSNPGRWKRMKASLRKRSMPKDAFKVGHYTARGASWCCEQLDLLILCHWRRRASRN